MFQKHVGADGRVPILDKASGTKRRVWPVDAREQVLAGTAELVTDGSGPQPLEPEPPSEQELERMKRDDLWLLAQSRGINLPTSAKKAEIIEALIEPPEDEED